MDIRPRKKDCFTGRRTCQIKWVGLFYLFVCLLGCLYVCLFVALFLFLFLISLLFLFFSGTITIKTQKFRTKSDIFCRKVLKKILIFRFLSKTDDFTRFLEKLKN